jgi:hypothetical protein
MVRNTAVIEVGSYVNSRLAEGQPIIVKVK